MTIISTTSVEQAASSSTFRVTQYPHHRAWLDESIERSEDGTEYLNAHIKDTDKEGYESRKDLYVNELGHEMWCKPELLALMLEVRKAMPGVDFLTQNGWFDNRANRVERVSVYRKGDNFTMGVLAFEPTNSLSKRGGYRSYDNNGELLKCQYIVQSPHIDNPKYSFTSLGSFSRVASSVAGALKNAKKYLRSYAPLDLARLADKDYRPTSYKRRRAIEVEIGEALRGLPSAALLVEEIHRLANEGGSVHQNAALHRSAKEFMEIQTRYNEVMNSSTPVAFVVIGAQGDVHVVGRDVQPSGSDKWGMIYRYASTNDLPEEILGAVSVLSMMGKGKSVDEVGIKISDTLYWVELEKGLGEICV
jgi:hypothetical protein